MPNPSTNTEYGEHVVSVTTTGSAGAAVGDGYSTPAFGFVYQISVNFHASAPATCDVIIRHTLGDGTVQIIGELQNTNTDIIWSPQFDATSIGPAPVANGNKRWPLVLDSIINVNVAGCDALTDAVVVSIQVI